MEKISKSEMEIVVNSVLATIPKSEGLHKTAITNAAMVTVGHVNSVIHNRSEESISRLVRAAIRTFSMYKWYAIFGTQPFSDEPEVNKDIVTSVYSVYEEVAKELSELGPDDKRSTPLECFVMQRDIYDPEALLKSSLAVLFLENSGHYQNVDCLMHT